MARDRRFTIAKGIVVAVLVGCAVVLAAIAALFLGISDDNAIARRFMLKPDNIIVEQRPDPAYDQLFPYYVEFCATSQWSSRRRVRAGSRAMRSCTSRVPARTRTRLTRSSAAAATRRPSSTTRSTVPG